MGIAHIRRRAVKQAAGNSRCSAQVPGLSATQIQQLGHMKCKYRRIFTTGNRKVPISVEALVKLQSVAVAIVTHAPQRVIVYVWIIAAQPTLSTIVRIEEYFQLAEVRAQIAGDVQV